MSILWLIPAAGLLAIPFARLIKKQAYREVSNYEAQFGGETKAGASDEILDVLRDVYSSLRRGGASCRPWVHDCIVAIEAGQGCDPEIALAALTETGKDLAGSRWDTDEMADIFADAATKLAALI